jgi:Tfp pilus assembly protein FimT
VGLVTGIAVPQIHRVTDSLAVHRATLEIVSAHRRARVSAILQSRLLELTIRSDTLTIRAAGDTADLWHAPGPDAENVTLSGPTRALVFSPVGLTVGVSNATYRLSRGTATRTIIISRLGRLRVTP